MTLSVSVSLSLPLQVFAQQQNHPSRAGDLLPSPVHEEAVSSLITCIVRAAVVDTHCLTMCIHQHLTTITQRGQGGEYEPYFNSTPLCLGHLKLKDLNASSFAFF